MSHLANPDLTAGVFDHSQEGIIITDAQGSILDVNPAFERITGYTKEEVLGCNPRILQSGLQTDEFYAQMWSEIQSQSFWRGEIWNRKKSGEIYPEILSISAIRDSDNTITNYVAIFLDISTLKEKEGELRKLAFYDPLTGLPNRALANDRLRQNAARHQRNGRLLAIAYIDLDGFKEINDLYGHDIGDQVLIQLSKNMKLTLRESDSLARIGGDEFLAILPDLSAYADLEVLVGRLMNTVRQTIWHNNIPLQLSASIGVSFFPQQELGDPDQLIRQADHAMYQAKFAGKNRFRIYGGEHEPRSRGRDSLIDDLREALVSGRFVMFYQPQVNSRTHQIIGVEGLLRWNQPERGLVPPGDFLPDIAGDIFEIELGWWCVEKALNQARAWHKLGLQIPISINVSAAQLQHPGFVDSIEIRLRQFPGLPAKSLQIEIRESVALSDLPRTGELIKSLDALGVGFGIDNFGTGQSTLVMLRHLPADVLKIDQGFIRPMLTEPEGLQMLLGLLAVGRAFDRRMIAEGVENPLQADVLMRLGCECVQGFAIAKPMPGEAIPEWVSNRTSHHVGSQPREFDQKQINLLKVIVEHCGAIKKLQSYLCQQSSEAIHLDPDTTPLGTWIAGLSTPEKQDPVYSALIEQFERLKFMTRSLLADFLANQTTNLIQRLEQITMETEALIRVFIQPTEISELRKHSDRDQD